MHLHRAQDRLNEGALSGERGTHHQKADLLPVAQHLLDELLEFLVVECLRLVATGGDLDFFSLEKLLGREESKFAIKGKVEVWGTEVFRPSGGISAEKALFVNLSFAEYLTQNIFVAANRRFPILIFFSGQQGHHFEPGGLDEILDPLDNHLVVALEGGDSELVRNDEEEKFLLSQFL